MAEIWYGHFASPKIKNLGFCGGFLRSLQKSYVNDISVIIDKANESKE